MLAQVCLTIFSLLIFVSHSIKTPVGLKESFFLDKMYTCCPCRRFQVPFPFCQFTLYPFPSIVYNMLGNVPGVAPITR